MRGGLGGESRSSFKYELVSEDGFEGEGAVSEVLKEASGEGSLQIGKMDLEGDLRIEE